MTGDTPQKTPVVPSTGRSVVFRTSLVGLLGRLSGLGLALSDPEHRPSEPDDDGERQDRPRRDPGVGGAGGEGDGRNDADRDGPVVTDDEVVPELAEPDERSHELMLPGLIEIG